MLHSLQIRGFLYSLCAFVVTFPTGMSYAQPGRKITTTDIKKIKHPLQITIDKEAYNLQALLDGAIADGVPQDLARTIAGTIPETVTGLLSIPSEPDVLVDYSQLVQRLVHRFPEIRAELVKQYGGRAEVRLNAAIGASDHAAMRRIEIQFYGTEASRKASLWLGDQQLAVGETAKARRHYMTSWKLSETWQRESISSRLALIDAMNGQASKAVGPITDTGLDVEYSDFHALLDELSYARKKQAAQSSLQSSTTRIRIEPNAFEAIDWGDTSFSTGWLAGPKAPEQTRRNLEWFSRCIATLVADETVYYTNRLGIGAIDLKRPRQRWFQESDGARNKSTGWYWHACRPLLVGEHVLSRRTTRTWPQLMSVAKKNGKVQWQVDQVISDPVYEDGKVIALAVDLEYPSGRVRVGRYLEKCFMHLSLKKWAVDSGKELDSQFLFTLQDVWEESIPCRVSMFDRSLVACAGSVVFRVDLDGQLQWLRRLPYRFQTVMDPHRFKKHCEPPLIADGRAIIFAPHQNDVIALDLSSGEKTWQVPKDGIERILGQTSSNLIASTPDTVVAIDRETGERKWARRFGRLMEAHAVNEKEIAIIYDGQKPRMAWVSADGQVVAEHAIEGLEQKRRVATPSLGPFVSIPGGLLVGFEPGNGVPRLREFMQLVPVKKTALLSLSK